MAATMAQAIARVQGKEFDLATGYEIVRLPAPPVNPELAAALTEFDGALFRRVVSRLSDRYQGCRAQIEDAVQDVLVKWCEDGVEHLPDRDGLEWRLRKVAEYRLLDVLRSSGRQLASIEMAVEVSGDSALEAATPCVPSSLRALEDARGEPLPEPGDTCTPRQVIGALQRFGDRHGRPPTTRECRRINLLPSQAQICRCFGNLSRALLTAGMAPPTHGRRTRRWEPVESATVCLRFRYRHGVWPNAADARRHPGELPPEGAMVRYFGGSRSCDVQRGSEAILGMA